MRALIFGATGMVGRGVLRACLLDPEVELVQTVGRASTGLPDPKLREVVHQDMFNLARIEADLCGFDACFFCLGVTSAGKSEADYTRLTYDLTMAAAVPLARLNPGMTFVYVSGKGTDSSEKGSLMWARVKGRTENALLRLPFKAAYMFRPGAIQSMHGERPRVASARLLYNLLNFLLPPLRAAFPNQILTTEQIGRAMINVARRGAIKTVLEAPDIRTAAG